MKSTAFLTLLIVGIASSGMGYEPYDYPANHNRSPDIPPDTSVVVYSVFLIGDARKAYQDSALLHMLKSNLSEAGENSTVIFLGDNSQPNGLPDSAHKTWDVAKNSLLAQLHLIDNYKGKVIFIPGNHDWANGQKQGLSHVRNQQKFIERYLKEKETFLPKKGAPGPVEIQLTKDVVLIIIDSHWWFHENKKSYSGIEDEADLFVQIHDAVSRNSQRKIIFATHYPLFSVGNHGGHFPLSYNLFPLLDVNPNLYIPLPGFIYTGYRKFLGSRYDLPNPHYKLLKEKLLESFKGHDNLIYVAGHEHNLQWVDTLSIHHIISGSAGITSWVSRSRKTDYAQAATGFARLDFYENGDVCLEFRTLLEGEDGRDHLPMNKGIVSFRTTLFNQPLFDPETFSRYVEEIDLSDSLVTAAPKGEVFRAGRFKRAFFGNNYRAEWITPVTVPVFDLKHEKGGLRIVKKGGGDQTRSLRLEEQDGNQWVLRSLDKDISTVVPESIRIGMAEDVVKDQMSASLPWAALAIPRIADAAGIYHTNPKVVYLTKDPRLGKYLDDVWEGLYLFEERPEGNRKDVDSFGRSKEIVGTEDMLEEIQDDPDHFVDQEHLLRSRLVDMLISDWDRHEDQWRWATFKENGKTVYRAIPRDRDMAFYVSEGFLIRLSAKSPFMRKMQGLDYQVKDLKGLNYQARHLDKRFLNELTLEEWVQTSDQLKNLISDIVLEDAVHDMPAPVAEIHGDQIIAKLKSRRYDLTQTAVSYFKLINRKVDIVGTDKRDVFLVERVNDQQTRVTLSGMDKNGNASDPYYQRTFDHGQTREIRLYGQKGKDEFRISGSVNKGLKVRIVGEKGEDKIMDSSHVKGISRKTIIYDVKNGYKTRKGKETRIITSNNPGKFAYNYGAFDYNKFLPLVLMGYNTDDGVFLGAGFWWKTYGFMKEPYASQHKAVFNYSFATKALEFNYSGTFIDVIKDLDLNLYLDFRDPKYTRNYFGMGNETVRVISDKNYNRVRISQILINPQLGKQIGRFGKLSAGLFYQNIHVENTQGRYISDLSINGLDSGIFRRKEFLGINVGFTWDGRNNEIFPTRGIHWVTELKSFYHLHDPQRSFIQLASESGFFLSFRRPYRIVLAFRIGGALNLGNYEFFQANSLGGKENLRGFRDTRFSGDAVIYQNTELRIRLLKIKSYISKGHFGIMLFNDVGRVWYQSEKSGRLHHGYGGGIWVSPFGMAILNILYERSRDEKNGLFSIRFVFLF